ncbi:MAG: Rne/Rng family ribonuclease [Clostridia bacterium]|nr:Rne/Rng family ribonuclease [Clostridia bacterium]
MYREILVQVAEDETKVAVLEEGQLVEIYVERGLDQRLVGNIYKGVVKNVLPGMQAAFVDIGLEKNAFLYVEDVLTNIYGLGGEILEYSSETTQPNIRDLLKEGQEIIVQIVKEPIGTKGARITTRLTLPGRYLVLMPMVDYIGISRRIEDEAERERLKQIAEEIKPGNMGLIVRTVAEGASKEAFEQDLQSLLKMWERIKLRGNNTSGPMLLHKDLELVQRILRDIFTDDIQKLSVNSRSVMEKVIDYLEVIDESLKGRVFLSNTSKLFEKYAVDQEIAQALKRKVWLKNGGYVIIDETEALTAVDVNTGKFIGATDLEDTVSRTNCEAAREIARQLRLRNIGGIIIIDFIDMDTEEHRQKVLSVLEEELKKDKVKTHILGITSLGFVEMTRKKVRQSLSSTLEKSCPYCEGKGRVLSEQTVYLKLREELHEVMARTSAEHIIVEAHPLVAALVIGVGGNQQLNLEKEYGKSIVIKGKEHYHLSEYVIRPVYNTFDLCGAQIPVEEGQIIKGTIEERHVHSPDDGIVRLGGYVVQVENGAVKLGEKVLMEIEKVFRTYAKAKILPE